MPVTSLCLVVYGGLASVVGPPLFSSGALGSPSTLPRCCPSRFQDSLRNSVYSFKIKFIHALCKIKYSKGENHCPHLDVQFSSVVLTHTNVI